MMTAPKGLVKRGFLRSRAAAQSLTCVEAEGRCCARRLLKAQKMRVGALATLKANRQLGVPAEGAVPPRPGSSRAPENQARRRPMLKLMRVVSNDLVMKTYDLVQGQPASGHATKGARRFVAPRSIHAPRN